MTPGSSPVGPSLPRLGRLTEGEVAFSSLPLPAKLWLARSMARLGGLVPAAIEATRNGRWLF